jgi:parallel beta-helix repeat protein
MKIAVACMAALLVAFGSVGAVGAGEGPPAETKVGGVIDNDAVWEGRILVAAMVETRGGARLTVRPGTDVRFSKGAGLSLAGPFDAAGTPERPIRFRSAEPSPAPGDWAGIAVAGQAGSFRIDNCAIEHAATAIRVGKGIDAAITGSSISDASEAGIDCQPESDPLIDRNRFTRCATGVVSQRKALPRVNRNEIRDCRTGIWYGTPAPSPVGNLLAGNEAGILVNNVQGGMSVSGNAFTGNANGLWLEQFTSLRVEGNRFDNNVIGIFCFRSSSPLLTRNRIAGNKTGISCSQLSSPAITANDIVGNGIGLLLTLSSYARINGNNLEGNAIQMKLDNMSHDWEVRIGRKPGRGVTARAAGQGERILGVAGKAPADPSDATVGADRVDATGNWWGAADTAEMAAKGADANIGSLVDRHDVPTRTYEGYPGEYVQDRIDYKDWKSSRIPDTGVPTAGGEVPAK